MLDVDPSAIPPDELIARVQAALAETESPAPAAEPASAWQRAMAKLEEPLKHLSLHWSVPASPIGSNRPLVGPLLVWGRRRLRAALSWYVEDRWERQVALNKATAGVAAELRTLVGELATRLEAAEARGQRLEEELARWREAGREQP